MVENMVCLFSLNCFLSEVVVILVTFSPQSFIEQRNLLLKEYRDAFVVFSCLCTDLYLDEEGNFIRWQGYR